MLSCIDHTIPSTPDTSQVSGPIHPNNVTENLDISEIVDHIHVPQHPILTERLRQYATRYLRRQRACWDGYEGVNVPGDAGRTERLRASLRDIEHLLCAIPEDRRHVAIANLGAVMIRLWHNSAPSGGAIHHNRIAQSCESFIRNASSKYFGSLAARVAREDDIERDRRAL